MSKKNHWILLLIVFISLPVLLIVFLIAMAFVSPLIGRPYQVVGKSMLPTYKEGAFLFATFLDSDKNDVKRRDVVMATRIINGNQEITQIQRVVALPGEEVTIKDGNVYINGKVLPENYVAEQGATLPGTQFKEGVPIQVPDKSFLLLGDNRKFSGDGRMRGFTDQDAIKAKVVVCYWNCK